MNSFGPPARVHNTYFAGDTNASGNGNKQHSLVVFGKLY